MSCNDLKIVGSINKLNELGSKKFYCKFLVSNEISEEIILGKQFLVENDTLIDFQRKCVTFGKQGKDTIYFIGYTPMKEKFEIDWSEVKTGFTNEAEIKLKKLLEKYSTVFDNTRPLSQINTITHTINMKTNKIVHVRQYKLSPEKKKIACQQVQEMLDQNLIESSTSPFNSPIVIVERQDKEPRFCVDYREINKATHDEDTQPLNIKDFLNDLGKS